MRCLTCYVEDQDHDHDRCFQDFIADVMEGYHQHLAILRGPDATFQPHVNCYSRSNGTYMQDILGIKTIGNGTLYYFTTMFRTASNNTEGEVVTYILNVPDYMDIKKILHLLSEKIGGHVSISVYAAV